MVLVVGLGGMVVSHMVGYQTAKVDMAASRIGILLRLQHFLFGQTRSLGEWGTDQLDAPLKYICHRPLLPWLDDVD